MTINFLFPQKKVKIEKSAKLNVYVLSGILRNLNLTVLEMSDLKIK